MHKTNLLPRDQELRFTVHDSPDYYQLKVSVFNDDKKTDLIGETWVNLQEVVVQGGGQNDLWHTLNCKGKYAGEIRIEITYYDTRPKQERPEKVKQAGGNGVDDGAKNSLKGPRQPKAPVKRRPLPSDPITGAPAPQIDDSPRGYPPPTAIPDHVQTPPRGYPSPNYIPNESPLQSVEYHTPPQHLSRSQGYAGSPNEYGTSSGMMGASPSARGPADRYDMYDPRNDYNQGDDRYDDEEQHNDRRHRQNSVPIPYELPQPDDFGPPPSPGGPPPPPPAHRSRNGSQHVSPAPVMTPHGSYGFPSDRKTSNQCETPIHEVHRHSIPEYTQSDSYQTYTPPVNEEQFGRSMNGTGYQQLPPQPPLRQNNYESNQHQRPRQSSYDARYNGNYGSMQPTVEDEPPTPGPAGHSGHRGSGSRTSQYDERRYDPSPAPLNLSGRGSAASGHYSVSTAQSTQYSNGYASSNSPSSFRDQSVSAQTSYSTLPSQNQQPRKLSDDRVAGSPDSYGLPPVPPTLVPGMDPNIAQEISDRIYAEKRASYNQSAGSSPRGRYDSPQYQPSRPHPLSYHEAATPFVPAAATYDERQSRFATATTAPIVKPRAISPDPRSTARKSVSPAPESPDKRRLSGVPFGPDSYNALNPSLTGSTSTPSLSARYDTKEVDPDAKIITHDGREVDPSDHIPESNYAPLLEHKGPKYASQLPDRNYRPPPQQNPPQVRTPLRQPGRPQSMAASSPIYMSGGDQDLSTPPTGRNRLQKKVNRMSAQPAPHSSPLAPISPYQDNSYAPSPRSLPRPHTGDYSNENYAPQHYGSSPGYRGAPGPPPIPAKVPVGPPVPPPQPNSPDAWALLEEMKNIDLGSGRARRRGR